MGKKEYLSHLFPTGLCVKGMVVIEGLWDFSRGRPYQKVFRSLGYNLERDCVPIFILFCILPVRQAALFYHVFPPGWPASHRSKAMGLTNHGQETPRL